MDEFQELKKKWIYNFVVSPKTNLVDKPEWYLKYTVRWIHEHIDSVDNKKEFILSMLDLVMIRLANDKLDDVEILVHTYNEVVSFTRIIRKILGENVYRDTDDKYDLMGVFSTQSNFGKIVDVEWESASSNFKQLKLSPNRWDRVLDDQFVDPYKMPRCIDQFLMLINAIKERTECFRQKDCQLALIELQCSLFDKLLTFLKKSNHRESSSINFLKIMIKEKHFLPQQQLDNSILLAKIEKLAYDYREFYYELVESQGYNNIK